MFGKVLVGVAGLVAVLLALVASTFSAAPLPAPPPYAGSLPAASPPADMRVFHLPTGIIHRNGAFGYRGGSFRDKRDFAMSAVLVRHPKGDVLIDTGFGRDIDTQILAIPYLMRAVTHYVRFKSAAEQLDAAGYDRKSLRAVLLTHAHWDHVSGVPDLGDTPVWITAEEHRYIKDGGFVMDIARSLGDVRYEEYGFEGGEYLGFPRSHDVYSDGAIVVVPAPGHTPGSVVVFLALPDGKRFAMVGDLVWQLEGITEREERAFPLQKLVDREPSGVRENMLRMIALAERFPELVIVPAHDLRAYAGMPLLTGP